MSKEDIEVEVEEENEEVTVEMDDINPIEQEAMEQGWVPKEEFVERGGNPEDWRDARWFLDRGDLLNQLKSLRGELSRTKQGINALKEHNQKLADREAKQLVSGLKRQYKEALEEGDHEKAAEINEWLMELKAVELTTNKEDKTEVSRPSQAWINWINDNPWYKTNTEMREEADDYARGVYNTLLIENQGKNLSEDQIENMGKKVSRYIKRVFPKEFTNTSREKQSVVMGSKTTTRARGGKKTKGFSMKDIPEDMRPAAQAVMETGVFKNLDDYVNQLLLIPDVRKQILGE